MAIAKVRAPAIIGEFGQAQTELVGKAVILTDGKAGIVESVWVDEMHGLRGSIRGHDGKWPHLGHQARTEGARWFNDEKTGPLPLLCRARATRLLFFFSEQIFEPC
ncbi:MULTISPECIES: hypothetical protein [unclassified Bradyrhizobium]|uniref:hypothetical protein n=1 Tax=unclassified Bradyrhizobium TaxID=2631580 RepID=UPI001FF9D71F|nr:MULTISPECIES: hypothetical protein [unclassified Bradyrhizobium]